MGCIGITVYIMGLYRDYQCFHQSYELYTLRRARLGQQQRKRFQKLGWLRVVLGQVALLLIGSCGARL